LIWRKVLQDFLNHLSATTPSWLPGDNDIVLFGRIRLALNIKGLVFPERMSADERARLRELLLGRSDICHGLDTKAKLGRQYDEYAEFLTERWLLEAGQNPGPCDLLLSSDEKIGLFLGGFDHLRFHAIGNIEDLDSGCAELEKRASMLDQSPGLARSDNGERIVSSPFLCGSGALVSIVLHLPALSWWGRLEELLDPLYSKGLCYRTWQDGFGDFLVVENLSSEKMDNSAQSLQKLLGLLDPIKEAELSCREELLTHRRYELEDRVLRACSICSHARLMGYPEFVEHLSFIRLGRQLISENLNFSDALPKNDVSPLLLKLAPAQLRFAESSVVDARLAALKRAELLNEWMSL
jgi:protein arginine kinase